jgi:hypothetical protein
MFQRNSKISLSLWQPRNHTACHKLVGQYTFKHFEFFCRCLYLMSLFYYRTVIDHLVMKLLHDIQLRTSIRHSIFGLECIIHGITGL